MIGTVGHRLGVLFLAAFERFSPNSWRPLPRPPVGTAVARGPGHDPDRVLLAGRASAMGWGVISHDLALAGQLARATSALTGRGTDVEVMADATMSAPVTMRLLTPQMVSRYDAIVLTLGTREAFEFMPTATWTSQLTDLLDHISADREMGPAVVVVGAEEQAPVPLPRFMTRIGVPRARALNAASLKVVAGRDRARFVASGMTPALTDRTGKLDDMVAVYRSAADMIAPTLAGLLDNSPARLRHPVDEEARWKALAYLHAHTADSERISLLLTALANVLSVRSADLYLVDRDDVRSIAATTSLVAGRPREETLSSEVLEYRSGLVIPDMTKNPRTSSRPEVVGAPHLRFYAGHPVESPDGHRVGVLSIVDTEPRKLSPAELTVLRDYAIRVGDALFEGY